MRVVPTTGRSVVSKACGKSSRRWFSWQFSRATSPGGLRGSISIHLPPVAGATGCHCVGPPGLEQVANNLCCSYTPHVYPPHQPRRAAVAHAGAVRPRGDRRRRIPILSHRWLSPPAVTVPALRAWNKLRTTSVAATHLMFTKSTSPGGAEVLLPGPSGPGVVGGKEFHPIPPVAITTGSSCAGPPGLEGENPGLVLVCSLSGLRGHNALRKSQVLDTMRSLVQRQLHTPYRRMLGLLC